MKVTRYISNNAELAPISSGSATLIFPFLAVSAVLLAHGINTVGLTMGEHGDSGEILFKSIPAILSGHYHRSRAFGVPLYELVAAGLFEIGGIVLVNVWSLILAIGSLFIFGLMLGRSLPLVWYFLGLAAFALNPIFLTNSTTPIEWMQAVFLQLCLLWAAERYTDDPNTVSAVSFSTLSAACILTRPDLVWVCVPVFLTVAWLLRRRWVAVVVLGAVSAIAAIITASIFFTINVSHELSLTAITYRDGGTLPHRLALAIGYILALFGPVGLIAAVLCSKSIAMTAWRESDKLRFPVALFVVAVPFLTLRFFILPTKVEYLFPLLVIFLLAVFRELRSTSALVLAAALVLGSVVQISLLLRSQDAADSLSFHLALNPGAIAQDIERRRQFMENYDPAFLDALSKQIYPLETPRPRLHPAVFFPGLISDTNDLVIGKPELYRLDNPRTALPPEVDRFGVPDYKRSSFRKIFICDKSVAMAGWGWRVLQPLVPITFLNRETGRLNTICGEEKIGRMDE